ncbi:ATPase/histidine kinase/DNA gyrase B/HSP90 domain protein [Gleimia coleocanis DSM 15436]|uniref:Sensor histidine kinase MtrB n=1 Tax=Gleimia coleocanis DSM 15436 TaxID=525245 RepID=C0VZV9_9ACTO|nr:MtrAB system histidine kinase MtrB [Gleimia coleocanis]EEH63818.1 ATPase/histidine kinase/DNA gyrase B/HSP90 domain protein [Gleimia coleocanis DSM 15436]
MSEAAEQPQVSRLATTILKLRKLLKESLSVRVSVGMAVIVMTILSLLFVGVTYQVRNSIYEQRKEQIIDDASVTINQVQTAFEQSTATTTDQVQNLANQLVSSLRSTKSGSGVVTTMLLRSPDAPTTFAINELIDRDLVDVITPEMRAEMAKTKGQFYQSVAIKDSAGNVTPGIVVGATVILPLAGPYELYSVYSLQHEEDTILVMTQSLVFGTIPVVIFLGGGILWVLFDMLRPVRVTAQAARELAKGDLSVRVEPRGEDEMAQLGKSFNYMAQSLSNQIAEYDELSQLQQRFVSDVSHELRTPLTTIRMAEEIIYDERDTMSPLVARSAELLHSQVDRFEKMLADLLEISRHDSNTAQLDAEDTDFKELVRKVVDADKVLAKKLGVKVTIKPTTQRCVAHIDSRRIERVLRNFLVNAIEHAEGKPVQIEIASTEQVTSVRVRDFGVGMTPETAARVFDRFFRADPARTRTTGGTGLGLSIAAEDVALHNGRIEAHGELGQGSAFMVSVSRKPGMTVTEPALLLWENYTQKQIEEFVKEVSNED